MDLEQLKAETDVENFRSSGPGGQHKNKRSTAIRLVHRPTGLTAISTRHRSLDMNLEAAFETLMERVTEFFAVAKPRRATRPTRASKERKLDSKAKRSNIKAGRKRVDLD